MWRRQHFLCGLCWQPLAEEEATFEHENLRGKFRDDRIVLPDGKLINLAAHGSCNAQKGSRR